MRRSDSRSEGWRGGRRRCGGYGVGGGDFTAFELEQEKWVRERSGKVG